MADRATTQFSELELSLNRQEEDLYTVELRFNQPDSDAEIRLGQPAVARFNFDELRSLFPKPIEYGQSLTNSLFADPGVISAFSQAIATSKGRNTPLRLRLLVGPSAPELQALAWETLCDPQDGRPLSTREDIFFSRYISSPDWRPIKLRPRRDLRALVVVSNPADLSSYNLRDLDVEQEISLARQSLASIPTDSLPENESQRRATLDNLLDSLRTGNYDILYLMCHGTFLRDEYWLWLEDEDGKTSRISGAELVTRINDLSSPPRLVVHIPGESGNGGSAIWLGSRLATAGIPATVAMQGNISLGTNQKFLPIFFQELQVDGIVDRAMVQARNAVRDRPDFWMPVLFMRVKSGRLWYEPGFRGEQGSFEKWPPLIRAVERGQATPILGPGLTEPLFGSRSEIAKRWADDYRFPGAVQDREDLAKVAQYLAINQDRNFPIDELQEAFRKAILSTFADDVPQDLRNNRAAYDQLMSYAGNKLWENNPYEPHFWLANLPLPIFLSLNPDFLLEEALRKVGKDPQSTLCPWNEYTEQTETIYDREPDYRPSVERPLVYHLFGRWDLPESIVITEDQYDQFQTSLASVKDMVPADVRRAFADSSLLFLGFSTDLRDFRSLRSLFISGRRRSRYAHTIQIAVPEESSLEPEKRRQYLENYFQNIDISVFWGSVQDFVEELSGQLEKIGGKPIPTSDTPQPSTITKAARRKTLPAEQAEMAQEEKEPLTPTPPSATLEQDQTTEFGVETLAASPVLGDDESRVMRVLSGEPSPAEDFQLSPNSFAPSAPSAAEAIRLLRQQITEEELPGKTRTALYSELDSLLKLSNDDGGNIIADLDKISEKLSDIFHINDQIQSLLKDMIQAGVSSDQVRSTRTTFNDRLAELAQEHDPLVLQLLERDLAQERERWAKPAAEYVGLQPTEEVGVPAAESPGTEETNDGGATTGQAPLVDAPAAQAGEAPEEANLPGVEDEQATEAPSDVFPTPGETPPEKAEPAVPPEPMLESQSISVAIRAIDMPKEIELGQPCLVHVQLRNTGELPWKKGTSGRILQIWALNDSQSEHPFELTKQVEPTATYHLSKIELHYPQDPGTYALSWQVELGEPGVVSDPVTRQILVLAPAKQERTLDKSDALPSTVVSIQQVYQPGSVTVAALTEYLPPPPPAEDEIITITVTDGFIQLDYAGIEYYSKNLLKENAGQVEKLRLDPVNYGQVLFRSLICAEPALILGIPPEQNTLEGYKQARSIGKRKNLTVELRLSLTEKDFPVFHWEYLCNEAGQPLATFKNSPFYRLYGSAEKELPLPAGPIRVLFAICNPRELRDPRAASENHQQDEQPALGMELDLGLGDDQMLQMVSKLHRLDPAYEAGIIHEAMDELSKKGLAEYEILGGPENGHPVTWQAVKERLIRGEYHVLHILAHGLLDSDGEFALLMEDDDGSYNLVKSDAILAEKDKITQSGLRLVILASCNSGDLSLHNDSHRVLAPILIQAGLPAVIAMQDRMDITAAQILTSRFYDDLARTGRIDMALATARNALYEWKPDGRDWGIPILLMSASNGQLFDIDPEVIKQYKRPSNEELRRRAKDYQELAGQDDPYVVQLRKQWERDLQRYGLHDRFPLQNLLQPGLTGWPARQTPGGAPLADTQNQAALSLLQPKVTLKARALQQYVEHKTGLQLEPITYDQVASSLNAGKHIILIGPPGTAKTTLARAICEFASGQQLKLDQAGNPLIVNGKAMIETNGPRFTEKFVLATATADWTTFDTVGGYVPTRDQILHFRPGIFLEAVRRADWLVIDEINRAEIDKAFGELFTVLSGQQVDLPYEVENQKVRILPPRPVSAGQAVPTDAWVPETARRNSYDYVLHPAWRIIGTMNVYDKSSLYQMSFAFMRRFAFVDVDVPDDPLYFKLISKWLEEAGLPFADIELNEQDGKRQFQYNETLSPLQDLLHRILARSLEKENLLMKHRALGPAILHDMINYVADRFEDDEQKDTERLTRYLAHAFVLMVVPQLDGLDYLAIKGVRKHIQDLFCEAGLEDECSRILQRIHLLYLHIQDWEDGKSEPENQ